MGVVVLDVDVVDVVVVVVVLITSLVVGLWPKGYSLLSDLIFSYMLLLALLLLENCFWNWCCGCINIKKPRRGMPDVIINVDVNDGTISIVAIMMAMMLL